MTRLIAEHRITLIDVALAVVDNAYQRYVSSHVLTSQVATRALSRLQPADLSELFRTKLGDGLSETTVSTTSMRSSTEPSRRPNTRGRLAPNVADLVDAPGVARQELHVLAGDRPRRLLMAIQGERPEALVVVAMTAGLRRGELFGLRWRDVDRERRVLPVTGFSLQSQQGGAGHWDDEDGSVPDRRSRAAGCQGVGRPRHSCSGTSNGLSFGQVEGAWQECLAAKG